MKLNKDNKAWSLLREEEKSSLYLQLGLEKSSWQGGEILKKSHYKYLEIKDRASKFLRLFTDHFELTGGILIPPNVDISEEFALYLEGAIMERLTIKEIRALKPLKKFIRNKYRNKAIVAEMKLLRDSPKKVNNYMYGIIQDFDKWNNFRILPREIREPSAFKRRQKTRHKKHLLTYINLKEVVVDHICELYEIKETPIKLKFGYILLVCNKTKPGNLGITREIRLVRILINKTTMAKMSQWRIYIFLKRDIDEFRALIEDYLAQSVKSPAHGLSFWPKYRAIIEKATNYNEVANLVIYRQGSD